MNINIEADKLIVISDLHLGSPISETREQIFRFLDYALSEQYNLCLNGDIVDFVHASYNKFSNDIPAFIHRLKKFKAMGLNVYYIVGNHEVTLENFIAEWDFFTILPFANVKSKDTRVHIEHGHLHDPFFLHSPHRYLLFVKFLRFTMKYTKKFYWFWNRHVIPRYFGKDTMSKVGQKILNDAEMISRRGFDYVIFGHTHCPYFYRLNNGAYYLNAGAWVKAPFHYIQINQGEVSLACFNLPPSLSD